MPVVQPKMQEIVKEINIPDQKVRLNKSNIVEFAKDVNGNSISADLVQPGQMKTMSYSESSSKPLAPEHIKPDLSILHPLIPISLK